jgi:hypothetical protein
MQKHVAKKSAKGGSVALRAAKPAQKKASAGPPATFLYTAAAYMFERRESGWYVARYVTSMSGEKPKWSGPFGTIETACLSAARHMAVELADRHTRSIEQYGLKPGDPLYGLKSLRLKVK